MLRHGGTISIWDRSFGSNIRNDPKMRGVAYESGLEGIFGSMPSYVRIGFLLLFFAVSYYFAMNKSSVIDKIGNYLTPLLLVSLVAVIILAIVHPLTGWGKGDHKRNRGICQCISDRVIIPEM